MQAVILAAGMGSRLGGLTADRPKALVRVAGRELILRVKDFLDNSEIKDVLVVTGYRSDTLTSFLKANWPSARTVHNPNFLDGSIRTIETALPSVNDNMLIMNVDHIYPRRMLGAIVRAGHGISAVCDFDRELGTDDMKVKLGADNRLKFIRKTLADYDGGYIGMTTCDRSSLSSYIQGVVKTKRMEGNGASVEFALGSLAASGGAINICNASGVGWFEVDTQDDLALAEKAINDNPDLLL